MKQKLLFRLFFTLFIVILVIILDLAIGLMGNSLMPDFGKKNLEMAIKQAKGNKEVLNVSVHPYLTYENTKNYFSKDSIKQHNSEGLRDSIDYDIIKSENTFRILTLGGSTTYGQGVKHPSNSWPKLLEKLLNEQDSLQKKIEVLNGGLPYGTSAELLSHYLYRYRKFKPDLVIIHMGGNDAGPLQFSNYNDEYTHWRSLKSMGTNSLRPGELFFIERSNIIKLFYSIWYDKMNYSQEGVFCHTKGIARENHTLSLENVELQEPTGFEKYLSLLIRNIQLDSSKVIFFNYYGLDESFINTSNKIALEKANYTTNFTNTIKGNMVARKKTKTTALKVCDIHGISFLEIPQGQIPDRCFKDQCHLNKEGQLIKSRYILPHILEEISY